jgi:hypothetical protein
VFHRNTVPAAASDACLDSTCPSRVASRLDTQRKTPLNADAHQTEKDLAYGTDLRAGAVAAKDAQRSSVVAPLVGPLLGAR